jgi:hypothetical protein
VELAVSLLEAVLQAGGHAMPAMLLAHGLLDAAAEQWLPLERRMHEGRYPWASEADVTCQVSFVAPGTFGLVFEASEGPSPEAGLVGEAGGREGEGEPEAGGPEDPLPGGLEACVSKRTGDVYYLHADSGHIMYERPEGVGALPPGRQIGVSESTEEEYDSNEAAGESTNDDLWLAPESGAGVEPELEPECDGDDQGGRAEEQEDV